MTALHLGVQLELVLVDLAKGAQRSPEFLALNPNGRVPVLVDGDFVLTESHAIMQYLADITPGQTVYPTDVKCRADVNRWLFWNAQHFQPAVGVLNQERMVKPRFGVDEDVCTGDHACIRLSGCPSLSTKPSGDPLKPDPVAAIDNSCVGCGNCGEVAEAAVLCPSFWRADIVLNPRWWDRAVAAVRRRAIAWLQRRRATGVLRVA